MHSLQPPYLLSARADKESVSVSNDCQMSANRQRIIESLEKVHPESDVVQLCGEGVADNRYAMTVQSERHD